MIPTYEQSPPQGHRPPEKEHAKAPSLIISNHLLHPPPMPRDPAAGTFVRKLYHMVEEENDDIIGWIRDGSAFHIRQPKVLAQLYLPKYFRHGKFSSLIRQLNFYSFYKVQDGTSVIYQHSYFRQGRPDLLSNIKRRGAGKAKDPWFDPLVVGSKPKDNDIDIGGIDPGNGGNGVPSKMTRVSVSVPTTTTSSSSSSSSSSSISTTNSGSARPTSESIMTDGYPLASPLARPMIVSAGFGLSPQVKSAMPHHGMVPPPVNLGPSRVSMKRALDTFSSSSSLSSNQAWNKKSRLDSPPIDIRDFFVDEADDQDMAVVDVFATDKSILELKPEEEELEKVSCTDNVWARSLSPLNLPDPLFDDVAFDFEVSFSHGT